MSVFILFALFSVCRWLAGYPLQCSYTLKAKSPAAPVANRMAAASVYAVVDVALVLGYWLYTTHPVRLDLLALAGLMALGGRFLIDWAKFNLFPQFKVASQAELAKASLDFGGHDQAAIDAAVALTVSNKYFWWMTGACGSVFALIDIAIVYLVQ